MLYMLLIDVLTSWTISKRWFHRLSANSNGASKHNAFTLLQNSTSRACSCSCKNNTNRKLNTYCQIL